MVQPPPARRILSVHEVAALFRVNPMTVVRWSRQGKLPHFKTLGGHRRFYEDEVLPIRDRPSEFSSLTDD